MAALPTVSSAQDTKLDFKDVLIRPKRSTLRSRKEVRMERSITFKHSGRTLTCVPVVVANMDTVGTFEMAKALCEHGCLVAIHKHYPVEAWRAFVAEAPAAAKMASSKRRRASHRCWL